MGNIWTNSNTISYEEWEKKQAKGYFIFEYNPNSTTHGDWVYLVETDPPTIIRKTNIKDTNWFNIGCVKKTHWIYITDYKENTTIEPLDLEPRKSLIQKPRLKRS